MKRILIGTLLTAVMGVGSAMAQTPYQDRREIRYDEARIAHNRAELHRDLRDGRYRAADYERARLRNDYRDLNHDRRDLYWDRR